MLARVYFFLLHRLGYEQLMMRGVCRKQPLTILSLHQIRPEANAFWSPLHPVLFEELLSFVCSRFFVTTFKNLEHNDTGKPPLILSFDDGYYDFIQYATPILHKFRVSANQNVIAECALTGRPPRVVRLCDFLSAAPRSLINEIRLAGLAPLQTGGADAKARFGNEICYLLKMRSRAEAESMWNEVERHMSRIHFTPSRMMSVEEIRSVAGEHEIGSHSYAHDTMTFASDEFFEDDLNRSEVFFKETLEVPLKIYAFPNGGYRPSLIDILKRRGMERILLVDDDFSSTEDRVCKRLNFYARSRSETRLRALGYTSFHKTLRSMA